MVGFQVCGVVLGAEDREVFFLSVAFKFPPCVLWPVVLGAGMRVELPGGVVGQMAEDLRGHEAAPRRQRVAARHLRPDLLGDHGPHLSLHHGRSKGREPAHAAEPLGAHDRDVVVDVHHHPLAGIGQVHGVDARLVEIFRHEEGLHRMRPRVNGRNHRHEAAVAEAPLVYGTQDDLLALLGLMEHVSVGEDL